MMRQIKMYIRKLPIGIFNIVFFEYNGIGGPFYQ